MVGLDGPDIGNSSGSRWRESVQLTSWLKAWRLTSIRLLYALFANAIAVLVQMNPRNRNHFAPLQAAHLSDKQMTTLLHRRAQEGSNAF